MNVLEHTRDVVTGAQRELLAWISAIFAESGAGELPAVLSPVDVATSRRLSLHVIRVGVPGRSADAQGAPLLGPPEASREPPPGVPAIWVDFVRVLRVALEPLFYANASRMPPGARGRALPMVADMPDPVARWFAARAGESADWSFEVEGRRVARAPTITWRPGAPLKIQYLATLEGAGAETVPLLSVMSSSFYLQSSFTVETPSLPVDPLLVSFAEALAQASPEPVAAELRATVTALQAPVRALVSVMPNAELTFLEASRWFDGHGRPYSPHLQFAVFVPVGSTALFSPTAAPSYSAAPPARS